MCVASQLRGFRDKSILTQNGISLYSLLLLLMVGVHTSMHAQACYRWWVCTPAHTCTSLLLMVGVHASTCVHGFAIDGGCAHHHTRAQACYCWWVCMSALACTGLSGWQETTFRSWFSPSPSGSGHSIWIVGLGAFTH